MCGRGSRSSLRILRPGLAITELAKWPLPGQPTAVWTLRRSQADELDALIVVSFANATLVRGAVLQGGFARNIHLAPFLSQGRKM